MGPTTIFDKSFLESLSLDEAVIFDFLYSSNIVPTFIIESIADLEKNNKRGKVDWTPEGIVKEISGKTPTINFVPNMFHGKLLIADLFGHPVKMDGRPILGGGTRRVSPTGEIGVDYNRFPESEILTRWQKGEFIDIERTIAQEWRKSYEGVQNDQLVEIVEKLIPEDFKLSNLESAKKLADMLVVKKYAQFIYVATNILGLTEKTSRELRKRWSRTRPMPFNEFAPYAAYILNVDLFFYICGIKSFISLERSSNKIDMSYLYYLPFTSVFVSSDKLHKRTVPIFMTEKQSFIDGKELKTDLSNLVEYYKNKPDGEKKAGLFSMAMYPPTEIETLTSSIYDKHFGESWRSNAKKNKVNSFPKKDSKLIKMLKIKQKYPEYKGPDIDSDSFSDLTIKRLVPAQKGSFTILPPEVTNKKDENK